MKPGWRQTTLGEVLEVLKNGLNCNQKKDFSGQKISRIESIASATFNLEKVGYSNLTESEKEK